MVFFIARHPTLALRIPATLSIARANASDQRVIDNYFDELETTVEENELLDKPCLVFNMDETGMPLASSTNAANDCDLRLNSTRNLRWIFMPFPGDYFQRLGVKCVEEVCGTIYGRGGLTRNFSICGSPSISFVMLLLYVHWYY